MSDLPRGITPDDIKKVVGMAESTYKGTWADLSFDCQCCGKDLKTTPPEQYHVTEDDRVYCEDCKEEYINE